MGKSAQPGERLQKYLAGLGVASRRRVEAWVEQGRIRIDGRVAKPGDRVTPDSRISLDGHAIGTVPGRKNRRLILYNKSEGEICTRSDPGKRPSVFSNLPPIDAARWVAVGRLDLNTRGLMLFTNDGELANLLMHPRQSLEREYLCRVFGEVSPANLQRLTSGVLIDRRKSAFTRIKHHSGTGRNTWYSVVLTQGRYREVRRLWAAVGCRVSRLIRVRFANIELPRRLPPQQWVELEPAALERLAAQVTP